MILTLTLLTCLFQTPSVTVVVDAIQSGFDDAVSIMQRSDGNLVIAQEGNQSVILTAPGGTVLRRTGGKGWGSESFDRPSDVSSAFLLDLFVADPRNRRVVRLDKDLQFIRSYDETLLPDGSRMMPVASSPASSGELFVLDADGRRVLRISSRGHLETEFGSVIPGQAGILDPQDITVTSDDDVLVLDGDRILIFDLFGNFLRSIVLEKERSWRTLSTDGRRIIAVAPDVMTIVHLDSAERTEITPSSIIGAGSMGPLKDAVLSRNSLTILTSKTVYRCTISVP